MGESLVSSCLNIFQSGQLAVLDRVLGLADLFDTAVSDSVNAIQGIGDHAKEEPEYDYGRVLEYPFQVWAGMQAYLPYCVLAALVLICISFLIKIRKRMAHRKLMQINAGYEMAPGDFPSMASNKLVQTDLGSVLGADKERMERYQRDKELDQLYKQNTGPKMFLPLPHNLSSKAAKIARSSSGSGSGMSGNENHRSLENVLKENPSFGSNDNASPEYYMVTRQRVPRKSSGSTGYHQSMSTHRNKRRVRSLKPPSAMNDSSLYKMPVTKHNMSPRNRNPSPKKRVASPKKRNASPKKRNASPKKRNASPKKRNESPQKQKVATSRNQEPSYSTRWGGFIPERMIKNKPQPLQTNISPKRQDKSRSGARPSERKYSGPSYAPQQQEKKYKKVKKAINKLGNDTTFSKRMTKKLGKCHEIHSTHTPRNSMKTRNIPSGALEFESNGRNQPFKVNLGTHGKRCKTCKKIRRVPSDIRASRVVSFLTQQSKNTGSIFCFHPDNSSSLLRHDGRQKSDLGVVPPRKTTTPVLNSLQGRGAFHVYINDAEDRNMNKSGIRFEVDRLLPKNDQSDCPKLVIVNNPVFSKPDDDTPERDISVCQSSCLHDVAKTINRISLNPDSRKPTSTRDHKLPHIKPMTQEPVGVDDNDNRMDKTDGNHPANIRTTNHGSRHPCSKNNQQHGKELYTYGLNHDGQTLRGRQYYLTDFEKTYNMTNSQYDDKTLMTQVPGDERCVHVLRLAGPGRNDRIPIERLDMTPSSSDVSETVERGIRLHRKLLYKRQNLSNEYMKKCRKYRRKYGQRQSGYLCKNETIFLRKITYNKEHSNVNAPCRCNRKPGTAFDNPIGMENPCIDVFRSTKHGKEENRWSRRHDATTNQVGSNGDLLAAVSNKNCVGPFGATVMKYRKNGGHKSESVKKRCDKIKSNKWRYRHEPYKFSVMKNSTKVPSPASTDATYTLLTTMTSQAVSDGSDDVICPDKNAAIEGQRFQTLTSESVDTPNSSDIISFSINSPKNKNNCSPSGRGKPSLRTISGMSNAKKDSDLPYVQLDQNYRVDIDAGNEDEAFNQPRVENYENANTQKLTTTDSVQSVKTGLGEVGERQAQTANQNEKGKYSTQERNSPMDTSQPISPVMEDHGNDGKTSHPSQQSSAMVYTSQRRRTAMCRSHNHSVYPHLLKNQVLKRIHIPSKQLTKRHNHCSFTSLGVQTSRTCLVSTSVQTSPCLERAPQGRQTENKHDGGNSTSGLSTGSLSKTFHYDIPTLNNDGALSLSDCSFQESSKPTASLNVIPPGFDKEPNPGHTQQPCEKPLVEGLLEFKEHSNEIDNEYTISGVSELAEDCVNYILNSESTMHAVFTNGKTKEDNSFSYDAYDSATQDSLVNHGRITSLSSIDDKNKLMPSPDSSVSGMTFENKSWVTRPRWEDANVDEINRRVERSLRLRQELQQYKHVKEPVSPLAVTILDPNRCLPAGNVETDLSSDSILAKMENINTMQATHRSETLTKNSTFPSNTIRAMVRECDDENSRNESNTISEDIMFRDNTSNSNKLTSDGEGGNRTPDTTETLGATFPFNARQNASSNAEGSSSEGGGKVNAFGNSSKYTRDAVESADTVSKPYESQSHHETTRQARLSSTIVRPSSTTTLSRVTDTSKDEKDRHFIRRTHLTKNSPPIKISKMENVIQSEYPRLVGELVQALPHVPLASFVEWFIETSNPDQFGSSGESSSPDARNNNKATIKTSTSVSTENDQSSSQPRQNQNQAGSGDCMESGKQAQNSDSTKSVPNANPFCSMTDAESDRDDNIFAAAAGKIRNVEENPKCNASSIRRILLTTRGSLNESPDCLSPSDKRRIITIRQSPGMSTIGEDTSKTHGL